MAKRRIGAVFNDQGQIIGGISNTNQNLNQNTNQSNTLTPMQQQLKSGITAGNAGAAVNLEAGNPIQGYIDSNPYQSSSNGAVSYSSRSSSPANNSSSVGSTGASGSSNSGSAVGGFLPTGSSATGSGSKNMLNQKSVKKRTLTIPGQDDTTKQTTTQQIISTPQQETQQPQANSTNTNQQTNGTGGYRKNADGTYTQVLSDGSTSTTNMAPTSGYDINSQQDNQNYQQTGNFETDFNNQTKNEVKSAVQGGEAMNRQNQGIQEGGLAYIDYIKKQQDDNLAKLEADKQLEQENFAIQRRGLEEQFQIDQENIKRQLEQAKVQAEFEGAWTGAGQSSGYVQGINNMMSDVNRTLNNLNSQFARASYANATGAKKSLEDYTLALKRAKADFDYQHRDILQQGNLQLNEILNNDTLGFDPEKIEQGLYNLATSVVEGRNKALGSYIDNVKKETDVINAQIAGASELQDMTDKQRAQFTSIINANGGKAIAGLSSKSIDDYVNQGYLSPAEAVAYKTAGLELAVSTLQKMGSTTTWDGKVVQQGVVSSDDVKKIEQYVNQGFTYAEAVATVASEEPQRFNKAPIQAPLDQLQQAQLQGYNINNQQTLLENQKLYNALGGEGANIQITDPNVQLGTAQYSQQLRGKELLQCGELVNDYIKKETGSKGSLGNTFEDKVKGIDKIGRSPVPVPGGVFAFDIQTSQGNTGHTGIVTSVNADGSINVLEANRNENSPNGGKPSIGTYKPETVKQMVFSKAPNNKELTMQAQSLVAGLGGTADERKALTDNLVQVAQSKGITVQEAKAELGLRSKTDDDFIDVRKKDWDKLQEGGKSLTQVKGAIQALNNPNPTTDLIGIVGLLKSIDPTSVARSDEVNNVKNAAGVLEAASTQIQNWKQGDLLSPKQRKQLQDAMQTIITAHENSLNNERKQMIKDFDQRGLDSNIIFNTNDIQNSRVGIASDLAAQAGGVNPNSVSNVVSSKKAPPGTKPGIYNTNVGTIEVLADGTIINK